jgi:transposase InsO family protein
VPDYLVRDRDRVYGEAFTRRIRAMGIRDRPTAPRSPWQNGYAERLIGSIRRECLDHVIVFGERHLRQLLRSYQRLTANEVCPENREHSAAADPRRIAPSLRPDLISDKDNPRDANYACALSSAGRGDDAFPISHLWRH